MAKRIELNIDQIADRYRSGESTQAIADSLDVSIGTIDNRLKRAGVAKRPVGRPQSFIALIHRVDTILTVSPGRSDSDIAEACGCLPVFVARQRQFRETMR